MSTAILLLTLTISGMINSSGARARPAFDAASTLLSGRLTSTAIGQPANLVDGPAILATSCSPMLTSAPSGPQSFAYQLQNINLMALARSRYDMIIMDYSQDGSEAGRFTAAQVRSIQNGPYGHRTVLAYMSIGEAENYRWYWNKKWASPAAAPSWLGPSNPDWPGNYKVQYWDRRWQALMYGSPDSYLDKIIAAGFDGVYLDIIDAYEFWGPGGEGGLDRPSAEGEMVHFVEGLANYARHIRGNPNFLVVPQNGEGLASHPDYVRTVSGIGQEDTFYYGNQPQPASHTSEVLANLEVFRRAGKFVLVTDYVTRPDLINDFYRRARSHGLIPYATTRGLDRLIER